MKSFSVVTDFKLLKKHITSKGKKDAPTRASALGVMSTKVKQVVLLFLTLIIGIVIGGYSTIYFIGSFTEYASVTNSVSQVKTNYWVLSDLQSGNIDGAIKRLELVSKGNVDFLKACDSITCEKKASKSIQEAISLFEKYEYSK